MGYIWIGRTQLRYYLNKAGGIAKVYVEETMKELRLTDKLRRNVEYFRRVQWPCSRI